MGGDDYRPVLEVRGVSKWFGGVRALDNVTLALYPGEVLALLGDNGAGKSTLVKVICGVYRPDYGELYIDGRRIHVRDPQDAKGWA